MSSESLISENQFSSEMERDETTFYKFNIVRILVSIVEWIENL